MDMTVKQRSDYTFKYNKKLGRHGWLRLTPAYSVKLVEEIIDNIPENAFILDPFSGTATTGIVAAEHGFYSHCFDINPFLIWLGNAKCRNYTKTELKKLQIGVKKALIESKYYLNKDNWLPKIHNITRWWSVDTLKIIAALRQVLVNEFGEPKDNNVSSLAWISFCRLVIETSSAAFNHVSMSFHDQVTTFEVEQIESLYLEILDAIVESASEALPGSASVHSVDSREPVSIEEVKYSHVVTSPPYPNRISYIRELRPYMYWTKFLDTAREAGELDWKAIGGTWGIATSRLQNWESNGLELPELIRLVVSEILETEEKNTLLMANYVYKYFHDMHLHFNNLKSILNKGAVLSYIVGNSSFYGVQVHTEKLLEDSLNSLGFTNVGSKAIRKRNSKKELFEYCVYATWK
ncbi:MAG: site-specific DNA-methyltransferase [Moorea sp. SIO4A1]|uniref:DNA adenine methylase n=2 Tax=unclassified Moorena TaxID=2683338 RepID=UPI0013BD644A|nr:DNA adenine methylase [Moorena sp. SIO4A1]NEO45461.1 site-specific DNA-methyltransferase [Moorena sp. SIO4A3]NEQ62197.1 site-specific DNA-methyltransferase [Moorena sp. SIO4A1]NEQ79482.1 site-specific DNA-methyltransferase [Moorena sp. SIO2I5]